MRRVAYKETAFLPPPLFSATISLLFQGSRKFYLWEEREHDGVLYKGLPRSRTSHCLRDASYCSIVFVTIVQVVSPRW